MDVFVGTADGVSCWPRMLFAARRPAVVTCIPEILMADAFFRTFATSFGAGSLVSSLFVRIRFRFMRLVQMLKSIGSWTKTVGIFQGK